MTMPKAVRRLLKTRWDAIEPRLYKGPFSTPPPARNLYSDAEDASALMPFEFAEIENLAKLEIFAGTIAATSEGFAVNEMAEDALVDFCRDSYAAFALLEQRLAAIRQHSN